MQKKTLLETISSTLEVKRSKFLSYLMPYTSFSSCMEELRSVHKKASHFVYAYRKFDGCSIVERFSDDGEPKGSSGFPVLHVLRGFELMDVGCIVVRYFGGTLLGVGGLTRAYTQGVVDCIQLHSSSDYLWAGYEFKEEFEMTIPYGDLTRVLHLASRLGLDRVGEEFGEKVYLRFRASIEKRQNFLDSIGYVANFS